MKKKYLLLLVFIIASFQTFSQISWERLFSRKGEDYFRCVNLVSSGGYILAGYINDSTANGTDAFAVRLDVNGDTIWTFTYNGDLSMNDRFYKIIETTDGGFITCGYTTSVTGLSDDVLYIKLNSAGSLQWVKTYGGSSKDRGQDIVETTDGYTITGYTTSSPAQYYDAFLLHTDFNGDTLWTKIFGDVNYDDANCIKQLPDGGYILGGQSNNGINGLDQFLIRTNVSGDEIWTKRLGTIGTDNIESIVLMPDGFVFAGSTNSPAHGDDGYIVKTDTAGTFMWSKVYGDSAPDDFHRIVRTLDGGFILAGTTRNYGPLEPNMWLFKTNSLGDSTWSYTFGGDNHDHGYSAVETSDGYIIAGKASSFGFNGDEGYVVKLGPDGTGINHLSYISTDSISQLCSGTSTDVAVRIRNFGNEPALNITLTVEITGGLTMTLDTLISGPLNGFDLVTIAFPPLNTFGVNSLSFHCYTDINNSVYPQNNSFDATLSLSPCTGIEDLQSELGFSLYPNPVNGFIIADFSIQYSEAKIELINVTGSVLKTFVLNNTYGLKKSIDMSSLAKGIYLFKVSTEKGIDVRKIVLE